MSLYTFTATVTVDAGSVEDALRQIGGKITATARHLGNGIELAATEPFFSLVEAKKDAEPTDLGRDPIIEARQAAEAAEAEATAAENAEPAQSADGENK